jgi:hypothetical protein
MKNSRAMARLVISARAAAARHHAGENHGHDQRDRELVEEQCQVLFHGNLKDGDSHVHEHIMRHALLDFPGRHA